MLGIYYSVCVCAHWSHFKTIANTTTYILPLNRWFYWGSSTCSLAQSRGVRMWTRAYTFFNTASMLPQNTVALDHDSCYCYVFFFLKFFYIIILLLAEEVGTHTILTMWRSGQRKTSWGWFFPSSFRWVPRIKFILHSKPFHLLTCLIDPSVCYASFLVCLWTIRWLDWFCWHHCLSYIEECPAQDCFKKIWLSRENIKVTLVKRQDKEQVWKETKNVRTSGGGMQRSRTADLVLDRRERTASKTSHLNICFAQPGAREKPGAMPRYKAVHTTSSELYRYLTLMRKLRVTDTNLSHDSHRKDVKFTFYSVPASSPMACWE